MFPGHMAIGASSDILGYSYKKNTQTPDDFDWIFSWDVTTTGSNEEYTFRVAGLGTIDWGDGNTTEFNNISLNTKKHTYVTSGSYQLKLYGDVTWTQTYWSTTNQKVTHVYPINSGYTGKMQGTFQNNYNATFDNKFTIPEGIKDLSYTFRNCTQLQQIPLISTGYDGPLLDTFSGCENATLADGFILPRAISNMFGTFSGCKSIGDITNIWPYSWFKYTKVPIDSMFEMPIDNNIHGTIPANMLWLYNDSTKFSTTTEAFKNCIGLTNYSSIPSSWK